MKIVKKYSLQFIIGFLCVVGFFVSQVSLSLQEPRLTVAFLDVGQGDSVWIQAPNGVEMLIDTGQGQSVVRELSKLKNFFDRIIDVLLLTHSDTDHIGGTPAVLERYSVPFIIASEVSSPTVTHKTVSGLSKNIDHQVIARSGERIILDRRSGVVVDVLFPDQNTNNWETNEASAVVLVSYGDTKFLLTGDAPISVEDFLVDLYGEQLQSNVLKLGHHGSNTSSSNKFLEQVRPEYAIVSAGAGNRYGHPHDEVIERTESIGAQVLETAITGTIVCTSNKVSVICK